MLKSKFKVGPLMYVIVASVLLIVSITTISLAKFSSDIGGVVYNEVASALIEFDDGGNGVLELSEWTPGSVQTTNFAVKNFNSDNEVNQVALNYEVVIKTSALINLNFVLTKTVSGVSSPVQLTKTVDSNSSFSIYTGTTSVLPHTTLQTDQYSLRIEWPSASANEDDLLVAGDYIKINVNWNQKTA